MLRTEQFLTVQEWLGCGREQEKPGVLAVPPTVRIEPWMHDFVKGRHSQEDWDAFFVYCEAGRFKRWFINIASVWFAVFEKFARMPR